MPQNRVKIRHEETGQEAEVLAEQVPAFETAGWTLVDDGNSSPSSKSQKAAKADETSKE